ncbi:glycoside hydrolase family 97 catalytic domain-containing protein, partial [Arthrospira platensis SPKY1]|nr:glycoside hydrolase family 97 catalytic domain-containing protein [Arthrospira platensis SPKY1]
HETSAAVTTYIQQMDTAFQFYQNLGIHAVKTGYVGTIYPKGEYHHGQFMVRHYQDAVEKAAQHQIAINAHEPIKATGIRRTWPNFMSREGLRGQEFDAWSNDMNPPEHLVIVPFTRMLGGPIDYTPGIFNIKFDEYKEKNQVNTTLAKQLAL